MRVLFITLNFHKLFNCFHIFHQRNIGKATMLAFWLKPVLTKFNSRVRGDPCQFPQTWVLFFVLKSRKQKLKNCKWRNSNFWICKCIYIVEFVGFLMESQCNNRTTKPNEWIDCYLSVNYTRWRRFIRLVKLWISCGLCIMFRYSRTI